MTTSAASTIVLPEQATTTEALALFDQLAPVDDLEFMVGRWQGAEISTGHPMDGLLSITNWYGKEFVSAECVHPLLFADGKGGTFKVSPNAQLMRTTLSLPLPKTDVLTPIFSLFSSVLKTDKSQARLRLMEHRGQVSATMIYDHLPINDIFRKVDENTVLGLMDYKVIEQPFFFTLTRETPRTA